jgi:hypothetical protein
MEHFRYFPKYRVLICRPCGRAIPAAHLHSHLKGHRKEWLGLNSTTAMSQLKQRLQEYELADPSQKRVPIPPPRSTSRARASMQAMSFCDALRELDAKTCPNPPAGTAKARLTLKVYQLSCFSIITAASKSLG